MQCHVLKCFKKALITESNIFINVVRIVKMLKLKLSSKWTMESNGAFRGVAYDASESRIDCWAQIEYLINQNNIYDVANSLRGFWGMLFMNNEHLIYIVSDIMRSYPIYYVIDDANLYISDDVYWLCQNCSHCTLDEDAAREFRTVGYVTGHDTLYHEIKQLQAGEVVTFHYRQREHIWESKQRFYYRYLLHQKENNYSLETLSDILDNKLKLIFRRLINYADGRPIVIPLSGGYDSRLIALMMKRLQYKNIITFSYGILGNKNSNLSRQIAKDLSIPWHFIEYTNDKWKVWYASKEMRAYERYAGGFASLPHMQDWPAVMILRQQNLVPPDSIFVPGHCIEVGERIAQYPEVYSSSATFNDAMNAVISLHYYLSGRVKDINTIKFYKDRISLCMGDLQQYISPASFFDAFEQQERQVKYINNSVRVYEFWGFDWWTPLWEREYQDFWAEVPLWAKKERKLYITNIKQLCVTLNVLSGHGEIRDSDSHDFLLNIKKICKKHLPCKFYAKLRDRKKISYGNYYAHPMAFYGCFDEKELSEHILNHRYHFLAMLTFNYLMQVLRNVSKD